ncbi:hypothetical protein RPALISO_207 [Ruegeria phage RpAliso]|nr:hypothetical protein RPALISO_207 [Ruegeria phage RpAliso]
MSILERYRREGGIMHRIRMARVVNRVLDRMSKTHRCPYCGRSG